ncbi:MAG: CdaR family protein [Peptococcaceae bacterium]|nr:CdaR family protein [Peptococcaceae bacterium]
MKGKWKNGARNFFSRNIRYKVISLACAVTFWFWVTGQAETFSLLGNRVISVQVELRNAPANMVVLNDLPTVSVEVNWQSRQLGVKDVNAYIDLKDATLGKASYAVEAETLDGSGVSKISPRTVPLNIDQLIDKPMEVDVLVFGKPAQGYVAADPILIPEEVVVRGPKSIVDKMEKVAVEINIEGIDSTLRSSKPIQYKDFGILNLFAPDPGLKKLTALTGAVEIIVPIYEAEYASKRVPLVVDVEGKTAEGYELRSFDPLPAAVTLIGLPQDLEGIVSVDLGTISIEGVKENKTFEFDTRSLDLPQGVSVATDAKINVLVSVRQVMLQRVVSFVPVEIRNQRTQYTYSDVPLQSIVIRGYPEDVQNITATSMRFWINVADLEGGTHSVELLWEAMPPGVFPVQIPRVTIVVTAPA